MLAQSMFRYQFSSELKSYYTPASAYKYLLYTHKKSMHCFQFYDKYLQLFYDECVIILLFNKGIIFDQVNHALVLRISMELEVGVGALVCRFA